MKNSLGISNFLDEISSFQFCFPLFLCIDHWGRLSYLSLLFFGTLNSDEYIFPFFLCLFTVICKASSDNHFAFLLFFFLGVVLITASCTMLYISIHISSCTLSDLIPWIYLSLPLYNCKGFDLGHTWWPSHFTYFPQFKSEFGKKEFLIWVTVSSPSCFYWLYRASPSLAAKNTINRISMFTIWWCPCVESFLVLLERVFAMTSVFSLQNSVSLCPASFCTPGQTCWYSRYLLTSYICIPVPYYEKDISFGISSIRSCRSS